MRAGGLHEGRASAPAGQAPGDRGRPRRHHPHRRRRPLTVGARRRALVASLPVFAACSAAEIRQIARWGEEVVADAGTVLLREDRIGYWFIVLVEGSVRLTRRGRSVATVGPGSHLGESAILGFAPQPATAVAVTPVRAFVLGRRELLSLAHHRSVQRGLRPDLTAEEFRAHVERLHREGNDVWRRLAQRRPAAPERAAIPVGFRVVAPRHGPSTSAFTRPLRRSAGSPAPSPGPDRARLPARTVAALVAAAGALTLWVGASYHPPVVVLTPGQVHDVVGDITVADADLHTPSGRYLLVTVDARRPNLTGLVWTALTQRDVAVVRVDGISTLDPEREQRRGRELFRAAAHTAIAAVAPVDSDGRPLEVTIRDRPITGPSAGLVYALALAELLDPVDRSQGRTIVATGALGDEGRVLAVGHVGLKASAAHRAGADLFLVPSGQHTDARGVPVMEVGSLAAALLALATSDPLPLPR